MILDRRRSKIIQDPGSGRATGYGVGVGIRFVLASASPARRALLRSAGVEPDIIVSGVDESIVDTPDADVLSLTLATMKAEAVAKTLPPPAVVLGCDSVLAFEGKVLGKPVDAAEATSRWYAMRGGNGVLHTGHCLIDVRTGRAASAVARTTVHFADISDAEVAAYVATGEPTQVAGAFTIDSLGGWFVERIEGDHGTVVGLSLPLLRQLLAEHGMGVPDLWRVG
jgi:septum formation protein